jgi:peptidyl-prolyl cis-trans isomerase C
MKKVLFATLFLASLPSAWADEAKPIATVNGREIPAAYADLARQNLLSQGAPNDDTLNTRVREALINQELLSRAAIDKGLDRNPKLAAAMDMLRREQLSKAYLEDYVRSHPVTDAEIQGEYDKAKANAAASGQEYKARHILVKTEAEAKAIQAQLKKKVAFDKLAREKSKDPGSAKNGGDLGWNVAEAFVKEFGDALKGLKKGETTGTPVKTQFGYHLIKLEDMRAVTIPPLDEVKNEIRQQLQQQRVREAVKGLRASAKIE